MASQQIRRITEQARSHGIALSRDAVRSRSFAPNVAGDQSQIDDRLCRTDTLMTLIDAHRPPEGNAVTVVNCGGEFSELLDGNTCITRNTGFTKISDKIAERSEVGYRLPNECVIDPILFNQDACDAVQQRQIGLRHKRHVLCRVHRCFSHPRIDDNDVRSMWILHHPLPHDRMGDTQIAADQHNHV